jgi:acyl-CoA thioester hydrolase
VRGYRLDTQGHLNQAVYLQYGEHVRWELMRAAGVTQDGLIAMRSGRSRWRPLCATTASCAAATMSTSPASSSGERQGLSRPPGLPAPDQTRVAELIGVAGMLDLATRRLVSDPKERFRALATDPDLLGL